MIFGTDHKAHLSYYVNDVFILDSDISGLVQSLDTTLEMLRHFGCTVLDPIEIGALMNALVQGIET
jgi:hypothetical protein